MLCGVWRIGHQRLCCDSLAARSGFFWAIHHLVCVWRLYPKTFGDKLRGIHPPSLRPFELFLFDRQLPLHVYLFQNL